ncbi:S-methyl-5'-thioadenosine phosphorylase [Pectobacterium aroidearum]|uniref:S-methyl-5'-thioadenosine phosphorylase n=1 Tax=Pectobacterium aroidearum TaxID=1201031 RepID=UPI002113C5EE|nr:S-methyl-5'-thioadenosine phosphorylase [Pectobacterium aroidearum]UUE37164.1 S-methyl-5'-thioadenosine phosphorylase [Pectobacterium aroidearum]UUE41540.1 S-methyl-5'-thioadenosine phosphorylase [Pectobacterium aroidearum]UUE56951.1 S-methyl-5'-thioadenosine phosphorylase [Pectobacterium aroidearum]UUE69657.1 S-methyl-5'-thioadenosine phosphorylase [Pectobacterium aroidearum]UUE74030.1 S-methyl-5'-thioadenosine phosphorylase [Pectobacterium aroidearum]
MTDQRTTTPPRIGIICGSGMDSLSIIEAPERINVTTSFGDPSGIITLGEIAGVPVAIVNRHGIGHRLLPSEINVRANIAALKALGVSQVISFSAVGSLVEEAPPGTFVAIDQYIDRTYRRVNTFFGSGVVAHVPFGKPVCTDNHSLLVDALGELSIPHLAKGLYVVMEGPHFSTKAESAFHRQMGGTVIGMTAMPEPKLCREAELCYNMVAMVTDYDCWHTSHEAVNAAMVSEQMADNIKKAESLLSVIVPKLAQGEALCRDRCQHALDGAIMTDFSLITSDVIRRFSPLLDRVIQDDMPS